MKPAITAPTSQAAAASTNVLTFATVPPTAAQGMTVADTTTFGVIPAGTTAQSIDRGAGTVTLSQEITGAGVGDGDTIQFSDLPGGLLRSEFVLPSDADLKAQLRTIAAAHPELALQGSQPNLASAFPDNAFAVACRFIAGLFRKSDGVDETISAHGWADQANTWAYSNGLGSPTISATVITAAAYAQGDVQIQPTARARPISTWRRAQSSLPKASRDAGPRSDRRRRAPV